jgi:hypothetical protein
MDVVFGDTTGSHNESGWAQGSWTGSKNRKVTVCLNSALFVAERDVFGLGSGPAGGDDGGDARTPQSEEGIQTQELLAETIKEMYPNTDWEGVGAQFVIIKFNDEIAADGETSAADQMETVLRKCEDKAWDKWLEDHPGFDPATGPSQAFIDYAVEGSVS